MSWDVSNPKESSYMPWISGKENKKKCYFRRTPSPR